MKPMFSLVLFMVFVTTINAQNLVPNPDFADYKSCPTAGQFTADIWNNPLNPAFGSTPDYFNECAGADVGVPTNFVGFQDADTGGGYAGLATYEAALGFREFIQAKLTSPTIEGACYQLTMVYSPVENAGFSDGLGMWLTVGLPDAYIGQQSTMEKTIVQESLDEWHTLTMQYVSPGGETHVTLGNFNLNDATTHIPNGSPFSNFGYYYIDFVGVELISSYNEDMSIDLGEDMQVCSDDFPITINSNFPNDVNYWSTGETGSSIVVNAPGKYYVDTYIPCEYGADTIEISIIPEPVLSVDNGIMCAGDSVTIVVDGELGDYEWEDGSTGPEFVVTEAGSYSLTLAYECGEVVTDFYISEIQNIEIPEPQDLELCETELPVVVQFAAFQDGINEFLWWDGSDAPGILITGIGEYGVEIFNECFSDTASFTVDVSLDFPKTVDFTDTIACLGEEKEIYLGFLDVDYEWHDGSTEDSYLAEGPGIYSVTVSNFCGIEVFEFEIDEAIEEDFDLGSDVSICPGDSVLISSPSGEEVNWSTGEISTEIWVKEGGAIIGTVEGYCVEIYDTIMINFDGMAPEIAVPDSILLCAGDTINISASDNVSGVEFNWNTGSEEASISVFEAGTYVVSGENNCGLVSDSVIVILGEALPNPGLLNIYEICEGDSINLSILTNGGDVEWSTGETDSSIVLFNEGDYNLSLTNSCKTVIESFQVVFVPALTPINLGEDRGLCINSTLELEWTGTEGTYEWSTGEDSEMIEVNTPGIYWLEVTGDCISVSDTIEILDLGEAPDIDLGDDLSFCDGDTLEISIGSAIVDEVIWNTSSVEEIIEVFTEGTFIVIGTNACGSDSDTIQTTINNQVPTIDLGEDQVICPGDSLLLDLGPVAGEISWSTGDEGTSIYVSESGSYIATLSSSCGTSADTFELDISAPAPSVDLGEDEVLCAGELLEFDITVEDGTSILWSNGVDNGQNIFTETATIWLELSNSCGIDRDTIELVLIPNIEAFELPPDITICDDNIYEIESGITQDDISIIWNTTDSETSITVDESGWYWLEASNNCFLASDSIRVDFYESAEAFDLGMDDTICSGESIQLEAFQGDDFEYNWQDNSNTSDYTVTESGTYTLEISNECGTESNEITILVLNSENIDAPFEEKYVLCNDVPLNIDLTSVIANSVIWNDGNTDLERIFTEPGDYFVQLINSCSDTIFNFTLEQKNCLNEIIYIPNSFTPNDDGVNDYFSIWFSENWLSPKIKVQMYNRWGEQIFYSEDPAFKWDGQFKGKGVNPGVYVFYFELEVEIDGETKVIRETGDITVVK